MYALFIVLHLLICVMLIGVVLVQSGKGGGLAGGAFGGSAAQTVFGGRGATDFFTRATMVLGAAFFITSLVLAIMTSGNVGTRKSLLQQEARRNAATAPAQGGPGRSPAPGAPAPGGIGAPAPSTPAPATPTPAPGKPATAKPATPPPGGSH